MDDGKSTNVFQISDKISLKEIVMNDKFKITNFPFSIGQHRFYLGYQLKCQEHDKSVIRPPTGESKLEVTSFHREI